MKIHRTHILVDDQEKALRFYTEILGFIVKQDIPVGEYRWLTLVSPKDTTGVELVLEPLGFEPARIYQEELFNAGIPYTSFAVDDLHKEWERLSNLGVVFRTGPEVVGPVRIAVIEDTCGNLVQLIQQHESNEQ